MDNNVKELYDNLVNELSKLDCSLPEEEKDFKLTEEIKQLIINPDYWPDSGVEINLEKLDKKTISGLVIEHCRNKIIKRFNRANNKHNYNLLITDELNDELKKIQTVLNLNSVKDVILHLLENNKKFNLLSVDDIISRDEEIKKQKQLNQNMMTSIDEITNLTNSIQKVITKNI